MKMRQISTMIVLAVLCQPAYTRGTASTQKKTPPRKGSQSYGDWLKREVRHELALLAGYTVFDILEYRIDGNKVTLIGQVTRPALKKEAEDAVKKIEGVEGLDNQIEILPPSPTEDQIRRAEYRAIYSQPGLELYGVGSLQAIHIIVMGGQITLEGVVTGQGDKDLANVEAHRVPGVFSVTNNLQVSPSK
jgi:hyperosmotically inducible periplasmic protein